MQMKLKMKLPYFAADTCDEKARTSNTLPISWVIDDIEDLE